jgi:HPr kinase/phosphorylase
MSASPPLHGTCIVWQGRGLLILGEPGSGKSSFALECIDQGAALVADDAVVVSAAPDAPLASAPETLRGLLALRDLGILSLPCAESAPLSMVVRLADNVGRSTEVIGAHALPCLTFPRTYPVRLALVRHLIQAASIADAWLAEDWRPERVPA